MLARWDHPDLGLLPPRDFIELMEREDLIDQLTDSLLRQSLACAKDSAASERPLGFAINVSTLTLENCEASAQFCSLVNEYGVSPGQVTFEVTETSSLKDATAVHASLTRLRSEGFEISADDFGVGYSSLQELNRMPFTEIKIDRMFVAGISKNAKSEAIVESIVRLAERPSHAANCRPFAKFFASPLEHPSHFKRSRRGSSPWRPSKTC